MAGTDGLDEGSLPFWDGTTDSTPTKPRTAPKDHDGHRDRLRERFATAGSDALADYELLELLLFRFIPRRDTKPIAKALLKRFGTLADVLNAPVDLLKEVDGIGAATALDLKIVTAVNQRAFRASLRSREILSSWQALIDYCNAAMAHEPREQVHEQYYRSINEALTAPAKSLIKELLAAPGTAPAISCTRCPSWANVSRSSP